MTKKDTSCWKYKKKKWEKSYGIALIAILHHLSIYSKTYQSVSANVQFRKDYSSVVMHTRDTADEAIFSFNIKWPSVKKLF